MSDITLERIFLKKEIKEIKAVEAQLKVLQQRLSEVESIYQKEVGRVVNGVTIKTSTSGKSYILTSPSGKSVVTPVNCNSHNERNVYWYDGKKGELALAHVRWGVNGVAKWLAEQ